MIEEYDSRLSIEISLVATQRSVRQSSQMTRIAALVCAFQCISAVNGFSAKVAEVTFSDSAPVPKFLNPGPDIL